MAQHPSFAFSQVLVSKAMGGEEAKYRYECGDNSGTTCVLVLKSPQHLACANVGDSRIVVSRRNLVVEALSRDHKPFNKDHPDPDGFYAQERERVELAGGVYTEDAYLTVPTLSGKKLQLGMTRTLANFDGKQGEGQVNAIVATPEVWVVESREGDVVMLGSDGVFDVVDNQGAMDWVRLAMGEYGHDLDQVCRAVALRCLEKDSKDNISVVVAVNGASGGGGRIQPIQFNLDKSSQGVSFDEVLVEEELSVREDVFVQEDINIQAGSVGDNLLVQEKNTKDALVVPIEVDDPNEEVSLPFPVVEDPPLMKVLQDTPTELPLDGSSEENIFESVEQSVPITNAPLEYQPQEIYCQELYQHKDMQGSVQGTQQHSFPFMQDDPFEETRPILQGIGLQYPQSFHQPIQNASLEETIPIQQGLGLQQPPPFPQPTLTSFTPSGDSASEFFNTSSEFSSLQGFTEQQHISELTAEGSDPWEI